MEVNWYALFLAITMDYSVEKSFMALYPRIEKNPNTEIKTRNRKVSKKFSNEDIEKMIKLKESMTFEKVGEQFGVNKYAIYNTIKKYKARCVS